MYFKVIIESGHVGAGKSCERVCYVKAKDIAELFTRMKDYPGLKSKENFGGISMVMPVDKQEYETGKILEWKREHISRLRV